MGMFDNGPVLLDSPETMFAVLRELVGPDGLTWRGHIDVFGEENPPSPAKWTLEINDNKGNRPATAIIGQYLALAYGRMLVLNADEVNV